MKLDFLDDVPAGCRYAVVWWGTRGSKKRHVETCHRKLAAARESLRATNKRMVDPSMWDKTTRLFAKATYGNLRTAIYDVRTGKRVK